MGTNEDASDRTRLRLVGDGDKAAAEPGLATVPLGPWAGASVEVFTSRTGHLWHADPNCSELRTRGRHEVHRQPTSGSLADLVLPDRLHCPPVGELSNYRSAAERLIADESACQSMGEELTSGSMKLTDAVDFVERRSTVDMNLGRVLEAGVLAPRWANVQRNRQDLARRVRDAFTADEERAARIQAAAWIRSGRTPREHQERYTAFLDVGVEDLAGHGISYRGYERDVVNQNWLPRWLEMVSDGLAPSTATASMAARAGKRADDTRERIAAAWTAVGQRWETMLDGVMLGHPGKLVGVFHRYGLRNPLWRLLPHALIEVGKLDWVVAQLPATARPLLAERDRGLTGLVLDDERGHLFDTDRCALLLRNILVALDCQQLCELVTTDADELRGRPGDDDDHPVCPLSWQQVGFASGVTDNGTTREACLPALQAAIHGTTLPPVQTARRRR